MASFPQIKATSIRESVGEMIRQALYEGRFEPGHALSEAGLAAEMGISRGPVREALLLLIQEGLVVHSPNRGFAVVQLTPEDLEEIRQVRLPLETLALGMARPHISEEDIVKLEEYKSNLVSEFARKNVRLSSHSDMNFHTLIWERSGNLRLAGILRSLLAPFFAYGSLSTLHRHPDLTSGLLVEQHERIIRYLQGRNEYSADECVRFHLGL